MGPGTKKRNQIPYLHITSPQVIHAYKDTKPRVKRLYILMTVAHEALVPGRMTEARMKKLFVGHVISAHIGGGSLG